MSTLARKPSLAVFIKLKPKYVSGLIDCDPFEFTVNQRNTFSSKVEKRDKNNDIPDEYFAKYCYHQIKDMDRSTFIKSCFNRSIMNKYKKPSNIPKKASSISFCIQCAIDMFIETNHCVKFKNCIPSLNMSRYRRPYDMTNLTQLCAFPDTAHSIKIFLYIVSIPSIFKYINNNFHLFSQFITFMGESDFYLRGWMQSASDWQSYPEKRPNIDINTFYKYVQEHIIQESFVRHEALEKMFNVVYHNCMTYKHLKWILKINCGDLFVELVMKPFMIMMAYKDDIDEIVDPPYDIYYFSIYVSLLIWKYRKKMSIDKLDDALNVSANNIFIYYGSVLTVFSNKKSKIRKVHKEQISGYSDEIIDCRDNVKCANKRCKVNYFIHKYGVQGGTKEMWESKPIRKWYRCGKCKIVYYCSRKCQKYDWNRFHHQHLCSKFV